MGDETDGRSIGQPGNDPIEAGLRAAFGPDSWPGSGRDESVLAVIERDFGISSHLRLREDPDEPADPGSGSGSGRSGPGRYRIAGEIGRGGVGVVLKGRDADLGREVAIKTLRAEYAASPAMVRRLVEEAQIGGQLQHPGVLPVYEMGLNAGHMPYFTMKLVRGRTLADLLHDRAEAGQERRRFLLIFEQVCQTVAYAHARGVVHRDLKPSNVMVGAFGEVHVVDWGLAKVLTRDRDVAEDAATAEESAIATVRSGAPGADSEAGSVLGTPAYMAPEQARGEVDDLDERCDVFALGAILYEILTGRPPYQGAPREMLRQAAEGRLGEALGHLEACGAENELVRIARSCLAAERGERPREASIVAREVSACLASTEERARRSELDAAIARARAAAERRARRLTAALGVLAILAVLVGGGVALRAEHQRVARLQTALALFGTLRGKSNWLISLAAAAPARDSARWAEALALTRQAVEQAASLETDEATRKRSHALAAELKTAEETARKRAAGLSIDDDGSDSRERPRGAGPR
jgi:serine/threonine-protein kinase